MKFIDLCGQRFKYDLEYRNTAIFLSFSLCFISISLFAATLRIYCCWEKAFANVFCCIGVIYFTKLLNNFTVGRFNWLEQIVRNEEAKNDFHLMFLLYEDVCTMFRKKLLTVTIPSIKAKRDFTRLSCIRFRVKCRPPPPRSLSSRHTTKHKTIKVREASVECLACNGMTGV